MSRDESTETIPCSECGEPAVIILRDEWFGDVIDVSLCFEHGPKETSKGPVANEVIRR